MNGFIDWAYPVHSTLRLIGLALVIRCAIRSATWLVRRLRVEDGRMTETDPRMITWAREQAEPHGLADDDEAIEMLLGTYAAQAERLRLAGRDAWAALKATWWKR